MLPPACVACLRPPQLNHWRAHHVNKKWHRRMLEVIALCVVTCSTSVLLPAAYACKHTSRALILEDSIGCLVEEDALQVGSASATVLCGCWRCVGGLCAEIGVAWVVSYRYPTGKFLTRYCPNFSAMPRLHNRLHNPIWPSGEWTLACAARPKMHGRTKCGYPTTWRTHTSTCTTS